MCCTRHLQTWKRKKIWWSENLQSAWSAPELLPPAVSSWHQPGISGLLALLLLPSAHTVLSVTERRKTMMGRSTRKMRCTYRHCTKTPNANTCVHIHVRACVRARTHTHITTTTTKDQLFKNTQILQKRGDRGGLGEKRGRGEAVGGWQWKKQRERHREKSE